MRAATWNVNSLNARLPRVLEFLRQHEPDVLLMQETKCEPQAFPSDALAEAGYHAAHHSAGRWAGVAIAVPLDVELPDVALGLPGEPAPEEARWIEAGVGPLRVVSVYVPNGRAVDSPTFRDKLAFLEAMRERVRELSSGSLLVAGDMNVCATDLDVYDPAAFAGSTHVTKDERECFGAVVDAGMVDAFRYLHPEEPGFTWWDYRQGHFHRKLGLRIDYLLLSQALSGTLRSCGIDRNYRKGQKPSDHAPLLAELELTA
ncbi:MAG: exodeoxyribonuclease III [Actinomycetota bacterium]|nr:exodeoxyribonuclease III [Actinomycetota bacterium]